MFRVFAFFVATLFGISASVADESNHLGISIYGSFLHTERVPNALFFFSDIEENDSFELRKAIRNHDIDTVVLSSRGGSVWEGLNMAGIIFDKGLKTYVPQKALGEEGNCASACSFMFFGGSTRVADGKLGVHQFYSGSAKKSAQIGKTQSNAQFTVSEIIGFLNEFGTPPFVFERMFQQKEMYYFDQNELDEIARISEPITGDNVTEIDQFIADFVVVLANLEDADKPKVIAPTKPQKVTPKTTKVEIEFVEPTEKRTAEKETTEDTGKQLIKRIQIELNRLTCNAGIEDGILGPKTRRAVQLFLSTSKSAPNDTGIKEIKFDQQLLDKIKRSTKKCSIRSVAAPKDLLVCKNRTRVHKTNIISLTIENWSKRKIGSTNKVTLCYSDGRCENRSYEYVRDRGTGGASNKYHSEFLSVSGTKSSIYCSPDCDKTWAWKRINWNEFPSLFTSRGASFTCVQR